MRFFCPGELCGECGLFGNFLRGEGLVRVGAGWGCCSDMDGHLCDGSRLALCVCPKDEDQWLSMLCLLFAMCDFICLSGCGCG